MARVSIADQVAVAERMLGRLEDELEKATAEHDGTKIGQLRFDIDDMRGVVATLKWIARDKLGCVKFLATEWGSGDDA